MGTWVPLCSLCHTVVTWFQLHIYFRNNSKLLLWLLAEWKLKKWTSSGACVREELLTELEMQQIWSVEASLMRVGWGWGGDDRVCVDSIDCFMVCYKFAPVVLFLIHTIQTSPEKFRNSALHDIYLYRVCLQNQLTDRILMWYFGRWVYSP